MKHLAILAIILVISGCQSVEEMAEWEAKTLIEHKRIFTECKGKARAYREWLKEKKVLMKPLEIIYETNKIYGGCFEENLPGLRFADIKQTTSLDIQSKNSIIFYTDGDHLLKKFLEHTREWDQKIYKKEDPWEGYWIEWNEALDRWRKVYKDVN